MQSKEQGVHQSVNEADHNLSRLATIGQISAGIAHEIRNPLTAVKGFLQLLKEQTSHKYLDIASAELDRAISALQNLLQVSKPDLDNESYSTISLCNELEDLLFLFQDQIYRVEVETDFRDISETIQGKRNQLKKAFFNLLKNAFEAIPDKGKIVVRHVREGDRVKVSIMDTGVGIPAESLELLGTPFYTTKSDGTGMGLTQVYSTIYQHGAEIDVKSRQGEGTTFLISFPVEFRKKEQAGRVQDKDTDSVIRDYFSANMETFHRQMRSSAQACFEFIEGCGQLSESFLRNMANELVGILLSGAENELLLMAKNRGKELARAGAPDQFVLEWTSGFRRVFVQFVESFGNEKPADRQDDWLKDAHHHIDRFMIGFTASFHKAKDDELSLQAKKNGEALLHCIPVGESVLLAAMPGPIDAGISRKMTEDLLSQIVAMNIRRVIFDWRGLAFVDVATADHLNKIMEGAHLMGCKVAVTGIRPEIAQSMLELNLSLNSFVEVFSSPKDVLAQKD